MSTAFTGLRISNNFALRNIWTLNLKNSSNRKKDWIERVIRLNSWLQQHIAKCYTHIQPIGINAPILVSQKGTIFTIQRNIEGSEEEISLEGEEL